MGGGGRSLISSHTLSLGSLLKSLAPHSSETHPCSNGDNTTCDKEAKNTPVFNPWSATCLYPVLVCIIRLVGACMFPYIPSILLVASFIGFSVPCLLGAGISVFWLSTFEPHFRRAVGLPVHGDPPPGMHASRTPLNQHVIDRVESFKAPFYRQTPWLWSGDMLTLYPYLAFNHEHITYTRRWIKVPESEGPSKEYIKATTIRRTKTTCVETSTSKTTRTTTCTSTCVTKAKVLSEDDGTAPKSVALSNTDEYVALDLVAPPGGYDPTKPFYLVLHGLNGGSKEPYVLDFVRYALARGSAVCVLIARGLMGTPCGDALFHGARTDDVTAAVNVLRAALPAVTPIALVGYSMGGIIAANYIAAAGEACPIACTVALSGSFDTRINMKDRHSRRCWQPLLAISLKENFVAPHVGKLLRRGIDPFALASLSDVVEFDTAMVAPYHGYESVEAYYEDMSAGCLDKVHRIATPLLAIHALDDPIMSAATLPVNMVEENPNLMFLVTPTGGHIGWAENWRPAVKKWNWMSRTALDYCEAVIEAKELALMKTS